MEAFLDWLAPVWRPHGGQREFLVCPNKIRVLACGRRWGKTDACAVAILGELFQDKPTRHLILAPTLDQAQMLFDRVVELLGCLNAGLLDCSDVGLHPSGSPVGGGCIVPPSSREPVEEGEPDCTRNLHPPAPSSISEDISGLRGLSSREMEEGDAEDGGKMHPPTTGPSCLSEEGELGPNWSSTPRRLALLVDWGAEDGGTMHPPPTDANGGKMHPPNTGSSRLFEEGEVKVKRSPYPKLTFRGHTVVARSGHVGRSLRGNEATHVIIDEAAYVPESLVTEVAMPMLATNDGRLTLISTPCGLNHFWKFFKMGEAGEHGVWSRTAPSSESPYVSPEFLAVQRELISERAFATEYEAQFVDFAGAVFGTELIEACTVPEVIRGELGCAVGVDWGRYHDYTAVAVLEGDRRRSQLVHLEQFKDESWNSMVGRVAQIVGRYPSAPVTADATGVGDPVLENLTAALTGHKVEGLSLTMANKGTVVGDLRMAMERGAIVFAPHPELIRQLTHFEMKVTESGHQKTEARHGYHDDLVIALILAYRQLPVSYIAPILVGGETRFSGRKRLRFEDLVWDGVGC